MTENTVAVAEVGTRELILDAARGELAEQGYEGATLRSIARRAGVDARLVRHYFRGKPQLAREALGFDRVVEQMRRSLQARGVPASRAARLNRVTTRFWQRNPELWRGLVACGVSTEPEVRSAFSSLVDGLVASLLSPAAESAPSAGDASTGGAGPTPASAGRAELELRAELALGQLLGLWLTVEVAGAETGRSRQRSVYSTAEQGLALLLDGVPGSSAAAG